MKNRYEKEVMKAALDVHMTLTGALDRGVDVAKKQKNDIEFLRERLRNWQPSSMNGCEGFDNAVKKVIIEALREHDTLWEG